MDKRDVGCEGNVGIDRRDQNLERDDGLYCHLLPSTLLRTSRSRTRSAEFIGTAVNICSDWTLSRIGSTQPCSKQLRYSYARCTLTPGGGRVMANLPRRRRAHRRSRHRRSPALPPPPAAIDTALCSQRHNAARPPTVAPGSVASARILRRSSVRSRDAYDAYHEFPAGSLLSYVNSLFFAVGNYLGLSKAQFVKCMRHLVTAAARQARSLAPGARPTRWNQLR